MAREEVSKELSAALKQKAGNAGKGVTVTKGIGFYKDGDTVSLCLSNGALGLAEENLNMQDNAAAFEAWALCVYYYYLDERGTVILEAQNPSELPEYAVGKQGHYHRFLYRALKFREQFSWFRLSPELEIPVNAFQTYLRHEAPFVNNTPTGEAGDNAQIENMVEGEFAGAKQERLREIAQKAGTPIGCNEIFRQLPVGLFEGTKSAKTSVFTGRKSAIDLWTYSGETVSVFELKAHNQMLGIITELMFYAHYMSDMFLEGHPFQPAKGMESRGYQHLAKPEVPLTKLSAFFLTDGLHPLITKDILRLMNESAGVISYHNLEYNLAVIGDEATK